MRMMKKLFAILAALVLCSAANATTIGLAAENTTIVSTPGSVVKLDIYQTPTEPGLISMDAIVTVTGGGYISKAMNPIDDPGSPNAYCWDMFSFPVIPTGVGTSVVELGGGTFGCNQCSIIGYVDVTYTGGFIAVSIAAGQGFGGSYQCDFEVPNFSTGIMTIIPEPMTIALLGLGGLLLRRRK